MHISTVELVNFRNFSNATINLAQSSLVIGANDAGKTNLIYAIRLLLDKTLSDKDIEPSETDFHIQEDGNSADTFSVTIKFQNIEEAAVLSILKGHVSENKESVLRICASRSSLDYQLYLGSSEHELEEISSRFYLKYMNLRYVQSQRDLHKFIESEKKHLLKISQGERNEEETAEDNKQLKKIGKSLGIVNERVRRLNYVQSSTGLVNQEIQELAHTFSDYEVHLDTGAIRVQQFIDKLQLGASVGGSKMMLGGDGRNNQILLALWKAKSLREHNPEYEVVFYCVEEPEAHLHPHQQRKLADYLINELPGQTLITSHSPQITTQYSPDSIVNIIRSNGSSRAASDGCSNCISETWDELGYRMSILPAEAFFSNVVFLVEGPSEKLFFTELATALSIDLDFYNISILSVDGVQFEVYVKVLDAMEIPWVIRTDNDVFDKKVNGEEKRMLAGINRCLKLIGEDNHDHAPIDTTPQSLVVDGTWERVSELLEPNDIYLSKVDLENDIADELEDELLAFTEKDNKADAVKYMASKKAMNMRAFLAFEGLDLKKLTGSELAKPLQRCAKIKEDSL